MSPLISEDDAPLRHYADMETYPLWFLMFILCVFALLILWEWICDYWWSLITILVIGGVMLHNALLGLVASIVLTILLTAATEYAHFLGYNVPWRSVWEHGSDTRLKHYND